MTSHSGLKALLIIISGMLCIVFSYDFANAQEQGFSFKKLMMPGEVSQAHVKYEHECDNCHETFEQVTQTKLCLDCHEDIALDITANLGFHGRLVDSQQTQCSTCHNEHLGREGDIVNLDIDRFDHDQTDFKLVGAHTTAVCGSCHLPEKKYSEAPLQCVDCHQSEDRHKGSLGETCKDCHSLDSWSQSKFDHEQTNFSLKGQHKEIQCNACHPDESYNNSSSECNTCHALNDVHNSTNGQQCENCHNDKSWKEVLFDHNTDTEFKLLGAHNKLECNSCHKTSVLEKKLSSDCVSCHQNIDEHNGENGNNCASCHEVSKWSKVTFDHTRDTEFELLGEHANTSCSSCHRNGTNKPTNGKLCVDCHSVDDVHKTKLGEKCETCHSSQGWRNKVRFSHELSTFPLIGMHAVTSCEACHSSKTFSDVQDTCISCHEKDDVHNLSLGNQCGSCHTPNDWQLWIFDHNSQSTFLLDGAHLGLNCADCHVVPTTNKKVELGSECSTCHGKEDIHNKRFGRTCNRCHVTSSFKQLRMQ